MGLKFREVRALPEATQQVSTAELGCLRFRRVASGHTSGDPPIVLTAPTAPGTSTTPLTSDTTICISGLSKEEEASWRSQKYRPGARMPGSNASLPLPSHVASRGPQFTPYQKMGISIIVPR